MMYDNQVHVSKEPQVQVTIEPDVITQPEVSDNQWEIPDDILDAQWDQILLQTQDEIPVIKVPFQQDKRNKGKQVMVPNIRIKKQHQTSQIGRNNQ
nr:uncharacterized protein LOC109185271 [Ipomoea batatas]